jgi:hypothetical protein
MHRSASDPRNVAWTFVCRLATMARQGSPMARWTVWTVILVVVLSVCVCAQAEDVAVVDPVGLSGDDAAAFAGGVASLEMILAAGYPLPRDITARLGWSTVEWATFLQGLLRGDGYDVVLVLHDDPGGLWLSLLVGVPLPSAIAYVPVGIELPSGSGRLGQIAWAGEGISFDPRYATFTSVLATADNEAPVVAIMAPRLPVAGEAAEFKLSAYDPEGALVAFVWTVDGALLGVDARRTMTINFREGGRHVVAVTAYDKGGASTTQSLEVSVSSISNSDCGCGAN